MITRQDINEIFSTCYAKAALRDDADMRNVVALYEDIRDQLDINDLFDWWEVIIYPPQFNDDASLNLLVLLKDTYFRVVYEKIIQQLDLTYQSDEKNGMRLWEELFAMAAVHFQDGLICMLCAKRKKWKNKKRPDRKYLEMTRLMQEGRWPDIYTIYKEIATNEELTGTIRGYAEVTLMQIVLYHFPEYSRALKHLENAELLLPDHYLVRRARAEYLLKLGENQKARDIFLRVIAEKPGDYYSFNGVGDCFAAERKLKIAESWYKDAIQKNYLQSESFQRLITLYADRKWFSEKEKEYPALLENIEKRQKFQNVENSVKGKTSSFACLRDTSLYQGYRSVAAAWYANENMEESEFWYRKSGLLCADFASPLVDIAYLKINLDKKDDATACFSKALELDKNNFDVYWGLAYLYEKQDKKDEAILAYNKCLLLRPDWNDWVYNFIGNLYYRYHEYETAAKYFRKAIKLNDQYILYKQNLGDALQARAGLLVKNEANKDAEKLYLQGAKIANDDVRWNIAGNYYFKVQQWEQAIKCYNKAISIKSDNPVYYENRGLAFENLKKEKEAEASYLEALKYDYSSGRYFNRLGVFYYVKKDYVQSLTYYEKAIAREPDEPVYLDNIAMAYEQLGQQDKAEPYYLKLLEKEPSNDKTLNQLGLLYYRRKEYEQALPYYQKAIAQNSQYAVYVENLGILYRAMEKPDLAIMEFEKALQLNPNNDITWNDTAVLYFNKYEYDKAIEYYKHAIKLKAEIPLYYENLGLAYAKKGVAAEAIEAYSEALKINPENPRILNAIGMVYYNRQEFEKAIEYYRKALQLESNNWVYLTDLALALRFSGHQDEAIEVYKKAIALKDDDYLNWNELGVLLAGKGNHEEAIDAYKKSIHLQPNDPVLYMNLALSLNDIGKPEEAAKVTEYFSMTDEVKQEVQSLMQRYLPSLSPIQLPTQSNDELNFTS